MKIHRFIVPGLDLKGDTAEIKDTGVVHQLKEVLRIAIGEEIIVLNGAGAAKRAQILHYDKTSATVALVGDEKPAAEPKRKVVVYMAILKRENFELVAQKATELGVSEIVPIWVEHSVKTKFVHSRVERIMKEATEQSGRVTMPALREPLPFLKSIAEAKKNCAKAIFFDLGDKILSAEDVKGADSVALFVGAEGGWTEKEHKAAEEAGLMIRSLGNLTLRAETAAIAASFVLTWI